MGEPAAEAVLVMNADEIRRALTRIAHEIVERNHGAQRLALVGILRKGAPLAARLAKLIEQFEGVAVPTGMLDVTLYRDDARGRLRAVRKTDIPGDMSDRVVVLVDEVIYTGRTVRAARTR